MKNLKYTSMLVALATLSCQGTATSPQSAKNDSTIDSHTTAVFDSTVSTNPINHTEEKDQAQEKRIMMIDSYRLFEDYEDPSKILTDDWFDLYEENGEYHLEKVAYKIESGYDDCAQLETKVVVSKRNSLLFLNFPFLKIGKIDHLKIIQGEIWPKESVAYSFHNQTYLLKGYGDIESTSVQTDNGKDHIFHDVSNYKLTYTINSGKETQLIHTNDFNDVFMNTLFVGDIDRDGKLDFIFSNPTDYEESRIIVILSSQIKDGNIEKSSYEQAIQSDC